MQEYHYADELISPQGDNIPACPRMDVTISHPEDTNIRRTINRAILDTGSDITIVRIDILHALPLSPTGRVKKIVGIKAVKEILILPYEVGISFWKYAIPSFSIFGSPDIAEDMILGRDFLNQYRINFDGPNLIFQIH
jgi:hypothetical protein